MKPICVLYATREGQARRIAEHVAADIGSHGLSADVVDARALSPSFDLGAYGAAVLVASVHYGKHEREMVAFVRQHRAQLDAIPAAFLSVSGGEATVEDGTASPEVRRQAADHVQTVINAFFDATGWHPSRVKPVAGAMLYTKYNFVLRFIIRRIAKRSGGHVGTEHDREYTDWAALDRFVGELVSSLGAPSAEAIPVAT